VRNDNKPTGKPIMSNADSQAGQRVRVEQTIQTRSGPWTTTIEGEVVTIAEKPTGSWYAHGKDDKLWLTRLRLRKDDGELVELVVGPHTRVTVVRS